jgi:hypothetical protein
VHAAAAPPAYEPATHRVQLEAPPAAAVPGKQAASVDIVLPLFAQAKPAGHGAQTAAEALL